MPGEARLIVVSVDRTAQAEHEPGELPLDRGNRLVDRLPPGHSVDDVRGNGAAPAIAVASGW